jgi:hypothetical protein
MPLSVRGCQRRPCRAVPWWVLPRSGDRTLDRVVRMQRVVFADSDGHGVADIGSEQARAGDAELTASSGSVAGSSSEASNADYNNADYASGDYGGGDWVAATFRTTDF